MVSLEGVAQEVDDTAASLRAAAEQGDASALLAPNRTLD